MATWIVVNGHVDWTVAGIMLFNVLFTLQQERTSENAPPGSPTNKETEEKVRQLEQAQIHLRAQHSITEVGTTK